MKVSIDNTTIPPEIHLRAIVEQKFAELESYKKKENPSQHYIQKQEVFLAELNAIQQKIDTYNEWGIQELSEQVSKMKKSDSSLAGVIAHIYWKPGNNIGLIELNMGGVEHVGH